MIARIPAYMPLRSIPCLLVATLLAFQADPALPQDKKPDTEVLQKEGAGKSMTWKKAFDRNRKALDGVSARELEEEMARLEKESPAMAAAVDFLALALADQIARLGDRRGGDTAEPGVLEAMPTAVANFALGTSLIVPRDWLCEKLNRWAAWVHFQKLRRGILEEPAHYCDE